MPLSHRHLEEYHAKCLVDSAWKIILSQSLISSDVEVPCHAGCKTQSPRGRNQGFFVKILELGYREMLDGPCLDLEKWLDDLIGHCQTKSVVHSQFSVMRGESSLGLLVIWQCSPRLPALAEHLLSYRPSLYIIYRLVFSHVKPRHWLWTRNTRGSLEEVGWEKERIKYACAFFQSWSLWLTLWCLK